MGPKKYGSLLVAEEEKHSQQGEQSVQRQEVEKNTAQWEGGLEGLKLRSRLEDVGKDSGIHSVCEIDGAKAEGARVEDLYNTLISVLSKVSGDGHEWREETPC